MRGRERLSAIEHAPLEASAQVKSAILLAGLAAQGTTRVVEPARSRDHTERLLRAMGVSVVEDGLAVAVTGGARPRATPVDVPGDLSSAAFLLATALVVPGSQVRVNDVGLNPTRTGFLEILTTMGALVSWKVEAESGGEPRGHVVARGSRLRPVAVTGDVVVRAIDELPVLFVAAAFAEGRSCFTGAAELRRKESDRIAAMAAGLRTLGVACEELHDGIAIEGDPERTLQGGVRVESAGDHRVAMALAVAALRARSAVEMDGAQVAAVSYPAFFRDLERIRTSTTMAP